MNHYLLITHLHCPADVQSHLAASMAALADVSELPPDSVRICPLEGVDLVSKAVMDQAIHLIMEGISACGESDAQMGFFTDDGTQPAG